MNAKIKLESCFKSMVHVNEKYILLSLTLKKTHRHLLQGPWLHARELQTETQNQINNFLNYTSCDHVEPIQTC